MNNFIRKPAAISVILGLSLVLNPIVLETVWAKKAPESKQPTRSAERFTNNTDFGLGWRPKPLVDYNAPPPLPPAPLAQAPVQPVQPDQNALVEQALKPMLPFVSSVEKTLQVNPGLGASAQSRLNQLQAVLFGEPLYQDAGELLSRLAQLFPMEAEQAHRQMQADIDQNSLAAKMDAKSPRYPYSDNPYIKVVPPKTPKNQLKNQAQPPQVASVSQPLQMPMPPVTAGYAPQYTQQVIQPPSQEPKHFSIPGWPRNQNNNGAQPNTTTKKQTSKKHRSDDPFDDPFFTQDSAFSDDSFYRDTPSSRSGGGGETLKSIGRGLAGLAMIAAPIAGTYFLGKTSLGDQLLPSTSTNPYYNPYYGGGYGYPTYGTPYGVNAYGAPYGANSYAVPYGTTFSNGVPLNNLGFNVNPNMVGQSVSPYGIPRLVPNGYWTGNPASTIVQQYQYPAQYGY